MQHLHIALSLEADLDTADFHHSTHHMEETHLWVLAHSVEHLDLHLEAVSVEQRLAQEVDTTAHHLTTLILTEMLLQET